MEEEYTEDELDMVEEFMQTSHLSKLTVRVPSQAITHMGWSARGALSLRRLEP